MRSSSKSVANLGRNYWNDVKNMPKLTRKKINLYFLWQFGSMLGFTQRNFSNFNRLLTSVDIFFCCCFISSIQSGHGSLRPTDTTIFFPPIFCYPLKFSKYKTAEAHTWYDFYRYENTQWVEYKKKKRKCKRNSCVLCCVVLGWDWR